MFGEGHTPRLGFETVEDRMLLAGAVNVSIKGATLMITGDAASNDIVVNNFENVLSIIAGEDPTDVIAGRGVNQADLDGDGIDISNIRTIKINLGKGNDILEVADSDFSQAINVQLGDGADALGSSNNFFGGNVVVNCGKGNDFVFVETTAFGGALTLAGAQGQNDLATDYTEDDFFNPDVFARRPRISGFRFV